MRCQLRGRMGAQVMPLSESKLGTPNSEGRIVAEEEDAIVVPAAIMRHLKKLEEHGIALEQAHARRVESQVRLSFASSQS